MNRQINTIVILAFGLMCINFATAKEVRPLSGGVLIEGYDPGKDTHPKHAVSYNQENNELREVYRNLKIPAQRRATYAWLLDNVNHQSKYLVFVGDFKNNGSEQSTSQADDIFKDGNFGRCEILGFTAEATGSVKGTLVVKQPSGSKRGEKPSYYLFSTSPGGNSGQHRCAIGLDF